MSYLYMVQNSAQATTAAPVKQPTGTAIRTMMQIAPAATTGVRIIAWGCSFDASAAAAPGEVELFETTAAATMSTAYAVGDFMPWDPNAPANTSGASGVPFNLSTGTSGFATAAVTEGTVAAYRMFDLQLIAPTSQYENWFPLGTQPLLKPGNFTRVRMTFAATVNTYIWILLEV